MSSLIIGDFVFIGTRLYLLALLTYKVSNNNINNSRQPTGQSRKLLIGEKCNFFSGRKEKVSLKSCFDLDLRQKHCLVIHLAFVIVIIKFYWRARCPLLYLSHHISLTHHDQTEIE